MNVQHKASKNKEGVVMVTLLVLLIFCGMVIVIIMMISLGDWLQELTIGNSNW